MSKVNDWCGSQIGAQTIRENVQQLYQMLQTMWFEHRDVFPNKGTYKTIRRLLIKNIALIWSEQPCFWKDLPSDLCKEIVHKADQKWLVFYGAQRCAFREYLIWKACHVGYSSKKTKPLCYVDDELKIVFNKAEAVGLANRLPRPDMRVEILFFKPFEVNEDVSRAQAKRFVEKWGKTYYSEFRASLPTLMTSYIANEFLSSALSLKPIVHSCHVNTGNIGITRRGKCEAFALNDEAEVVPVRNVEKAKKLYASIYMSLEDFTAINPHASFPCRYYVSNKRGE